MTGRRWTEDQLSMLAELYPLASTDDLLSAFPGHKMHALAERARKHGIRCLVKRYPKGMSTPEFFNQNVLTSANQVTVCGNIVQLNPRQVARFWSRVDRSTACWEWKLGTDKDGYGKFALTLGRENGRQIQGHVRAHRVAYELANAPIENHLLVLHSCDNPPCCNPEHLSLGDVIANTLDRVRRNRSATGDRNGARRRVTSGE